MSSANKVALITGANGGLGLATAELLASKHSYHVIIGSRDAANGSEAADSLKAKGLTASSVQLDLSSDESINAAVKEIESQYGKLDALINNAGVYLEFSAKDLSLRDLLRQSVETNLIGTAAVTDAFLPLLRKSEAPRVVFVSSTNASIGQTLNKESPTYGSAATAYKTSKAAANMLALTYAVKLGEVGGLVNVVCPGFIKTKMVGFNPHARDPAEAALKVAEMATLPDGGPTGKFVSSWGEVPW